MDEVCGTLIEEFSFQGIRPVVARMPLEIEVEPMLPPPSAPVHHFVLPEIQPDSCAPRIEAGFLASYAASRGIDAAPDAMGPSFSALEHVFPLAQGIAFRDGGPREPGVLALSAPSTPRGLSVEPMEVGVSELELTQPKLALPITTFMPNGIGLPRAKSLRLVLSPAPVAEGTLEFALIERFPELAKQRPTVTFEIKLLESAESAPPATEPAYQPTPNGKTDVVPITPRRVLEALSQMQADRTRKERQEPPLSRTVKPIPTPAVSPATEVLAAGFDSMLFAAKPRLLRYSTQPLRPKMAVGTAAGPLPVRSGGAAAPSGRKAHAGEGKNAASKFSPRSMLHLDDVNGTGDSDSEAPTLLGKLGGLFGKKTRAGTQETRSRKSEAGMK
jgi:hypothetical protein